MTQHDYCYQYCYCICIILILLHLKVLKNMDKIKYILVDLYNIYIYINTKLKINHLNI